MNWDEHYVREEFAKVTRFDPKNIPHELNFLEEWDEREKFNLTADFGALDYKNEFDYDDDEKNQPKQWENPQAFKMQPLPPLWTVIMKFLHVIEMMNQQSSSSKGSVPKRSRKLKMSSDPKRKPEIDLEVPEEPGEVSEPFSMLNNKNNGKGMGRGKKKALRKRNEAEDELHQEICRKQEEAFRQVDNNCDVLKYQNADMDMEPVTPRHSTEEDPREGGGLADIADMIYQKDEEEKAGYRNATNINFKFSSKLGKGRGKKKKK